MTIRAIQGFEHIKPTTVGEAQVLHPEISTYLGFKAPTYSTNWFRDPAGGVSDASGPMIVSSDFRIDGQSLRLRRPDSGSFNSDFNGSRPVEIGVNFASTQRAVLAGAVKYSKITESSMPLAQFRYNDGSTDIEQCSIWVTSDGAILASSVDFDLTNTGLIGPTPVTDAITGPGVFNFEAFQFIEIDIDYRLTVFTAPTVTIYINGIQVALWTSNNLSKGSFAFLTAAQFINPQNTYFPDDDYDMFLDDVYITTDEAPYGPQHIVLLQPDATIQNEFVITGGAANSFEAVDGTFDKSDLTEFISNDAADDREILSFADTPANIVSITAVQVGIFSSVDTGSVLYDVEFIEGANINSARLSQANTTPTFQWVSWSVAPDDGAWTVADLNALQVGIEIN